MKSFNAECVQWVQIDMGGYKGSWAFGVSYGLSSELGNMYFQAGTQAGQRKSHGSETSF